MKWSGLEGIGTTEICCSNLYFEVVFVIMVVGGEFVGGEGRTITSWYDISRAVYEHTCEVQNVLCQQNFVCEIHALIGTGKVG